MQVALGAMFRNSCGYLPRYFAIVNRFWDALYAHGDSLRLIYAEGDSTDDTWNQLHQRCKALGVPYTIIKREHGKRWSGNPDLSERWEALSYVTNGILDEVKETDDVFLYIESDLIWCPPTALRLIDHLKNVDVVSPMNFTMHGAMYDLWGHRRRGIRFGPYHPYHPELPPEGLPEGQLIMMDCTGSGWAMKGEVARKVRFGEGAPHTCGLGLSIYKHGYTLWLDPNLAVWQL